MRWTDRQTDNILIKGSWWCSEDVLLLVIILASVQHTKFCCWGIRLIHFVHPSFMVDFLYTNLVHIDAVAVQYAQTLYECEALTLTLNQYKT